MSLELHFDDEESIRAAIDIAVMNRRDGDVPGGLRVVDLGASRGEAAACVLRELANAEIVIADSDDVALRHALQRLAVDFPDADTLFARFAPDEAARRVHLSHPAELILYHASDEQAAITRALVAWLPWVAPGAIVWLHGFAPPPLTWGLPESPGVALAVADLTGSGMLLEVGRYGTAWIGTAPRR